MTREEEAWDLAGLDLTEGPLRVANWPRPSWVHVEGDVVHYRLAERQDMGSLGSRWWVTAVEKRPEAMLREFVRLARVPETGLAAELEPFALRWGMLGLCRHGLPATHPVTANMLPMDMSCDWMRPTGTEPVALWREYARQARAVLDASAALASEEYAARHPETVGPSRQAEERLDAALSIASRWFPPGSTAPPVVEDDLEGDERVARRRWLLNRAIGLWTDGAGVHLVASVGGTEPVRLGVRSLFGALAVQLLFAAVGGSVARFCAGCDELFYLSRRPRGYERSWCPSCTEEGADRKAASERFRARDSADPNRPKHARGRRARID